MKALRVALLAAAASVAMGGAAFAQDDELSLSFNVGAASDYVFRGVSQTDENPQLYGGADASFGIAYAGIWLSNVDFGDSTDLEYDLYVGVTPTLGPVSLDLAYIYYGYTNKPAGPDLAYSEFKVAGSVPAGPAEIGAAVYYSDDFFGETGPATYYEVNGSIPIGATKASVSGALGHQVLKGNFDYNTWNIGVGYEINDHVGVDLRYHDTDAHDFGDLYDARVVLGVSASF